MIYSGNYIIYYVLKVASEFLGCLVLSKETQHYLVKPPKPPGMPSRGFFVLGVCHGASAVSMRSAGASERRPASFERRCPLLAEESPTRATIANRTVCATNSPMEGSGRWLAIEEAICLMVASSMKGASLRAGKRALRCRSAPLCQNNDNRRPRLDARLPRFSRLPAAAPRRAVARRPNGFACRHRRIVAARNSCRALLLADAVADARRGRQRIGIEDITKGTDY